MKRTSNENMYSLALGKTSQSIIFSISDSTLCPYMVEGAKELCGISFM